MLVQSRAESVKYRHPVQRALSHQYRSYSCFPWAPSQLSLVFMHNAPSQQQSMPAGSRMSAQLRMSVRA